MKNNKIKFARRLRAIVCVPSFNEFNRTTRIHSPNIIIIFPIASTFSQWIYSRLQRQTRQISTGTPCSSVRPFVLASKSLLLYSLDYFIDDAFEWQTNIASECNRARTSKVDAMSEQHSQINTFILRDIHSTHTSHKIELNSSSRSKRID